MYLKTLALVEKHKFTRIRGVSTMSSPPSGHMPSRVA